MTKYAVFYYPPDKTATEAVDEFKALSDAGCTIAKSRGAEQHPTRTGSLGTWTRTTESTPARRIGRLPPREDAAGFFSYAYGSLGVDAGPDAAK